MTEIGIGDTIQILYSKWEQVQLDDSYPKKMPGLGMGTKIQSRRVSGTIPWQSIPVKSRKRGALRASLA